MLKIFLPIIAIASLSVSAYAGPVKAEPVTKQETAELSVQVASEESENAEKQEGGLLGIPNGLIALAAAVAAIYVATQD